MWDFLHRTSCAHGKSESRDGWTRGVSEKEWALLSNFVFDGVFVQYYKHDTHFGLEELLFCFR